MDEGGGLHSQRAQKTCPRFKPGLQCTGMLALPSRVTITVLRAALPPQVAHAE